jgi:hypothetical protein
MTSSFLPKQNNQKQLATKFTDTGNTNSIPATSKTSQKDMESQSASLST